MFFRLLILGLIICQFQLFAQTNPPGFAFLSLNLKNLLLPASYNERSLYHSQDPQSIKLRLFLKLLKKSSPDIIGICEIGRNSEYAFLKTLLNKPPFNYAYSTSIHGSDTLRQLILFSRFPISKTQSVSKTILASEKYISMRRGILDAIVDTPLGKINFVGIHLKSNYPNEQAARLVRRYEAEMLRSHLKNASFPLLVYGDFNDYKKTPILKRIRGFSGDLPYLQPLNLTGPNGHYWTYYWELRDLYGRIDFILVDSTLKPLVNSRKSRILEIDHFLKLSDHRPLLVYFSQKPH